MACALSLCCLLVILLLYRKLLIHVDSDFASADRLRKSCIEFVITNRQTMSGCDRTHTARSSCRVACMTFPHRAQAQDVLH